MLDETWGLKDGEDNKISKPKSKRNSEPMDDQFEKEFNGEMISLESISPKCPKMTNVWFLSLLITHKTENLKFY